MNLKAEIECPYCRLKQMVVCDLDDKEWRRRVKFCDCEEGGCDQPFVVEFHLSIIGVPFGLSHGHSGESYPEYQQSLKSEYDDATSI